MQTIEEKTQPAADDAAKIHRVLFSNPDTVRATPVRDIDEARSAAAPVFSSTY